MTASARLPLQGTYARDHLGWPMRLVLAVNDILHGSPLVVSTVTGRLDADAVLRAIGGWFDGPIIDRRVAWPTPPECRWATLPGEEEAR